MTRTDAEQAVRLFCGVWRKETGQENVRVEALRFDDFFAWMQRSAPNALGFKTATSIRHDVEAWFADELGLKAKGKAGR